jgi:outer membrane receptor protein involved in Fe transport
MLLLGVGAPALVTGATARAQTVTSAPAGDAPADPGAAAQETAMGIADAAVKPVKKDKDSADEADRDEVVVTGTRIVRPNMTSNAPITVVDEKFLRERGLARIEDALSQIPQVTPMLGLQGNGWTAGRAGVSLRRLGAGRTLTLLNGQRIENDVNLVPGALIDRIDILTGGASAVYGSDAVAGVVNYIIKRRFNGLIFDAEASGISHTNDNATMLSLARAGGYPLPQRNFLGGGNFYASLAAGKDLFDHRVNVSAFVTFKEAKPLRFSEIDTTLCPLQMNAIDASVFRNDTWTCSGTTYNPYQYYGVNGKYYSNDRDGSRSFREYSVDDESRVPRDELIQRGDKTVNAGGFVTADLFSGIRLDGSFLYSRLRGRSELAVTDAYYTPAARINCDNPFLSAQQAGVFCGAAAGTSALSDPVETTLWRPEFIQTNKPQTNSWRGTVTLSGRIVDKIRFEATYLRSRDIFRNTGTNIYTYDPDVFAQGLQVRNVNGVPTCLSKIDGTNPGCVPIDMFSTKPVDQAVWDYLSGRGDSWQQNDLEMLNGVVSGTLEDYGIKSPFTDEGVGFSIVAEQRKVRSQSAGTGMWSNWTKFDGRATVRELGAELDVPLVADRPFVHELSINGGYRISDYTTYEKLVQTWKVEGTWAPVDGLRFRGSYNKALRVPVLERLEGENRYPDTFAIDLCAPPRAGSTLQRLSFEQCSFGGVTRAQYDALTSYGACNAAGECPATLINGGNPALQPERSRSYTFGFVLQPKAVRDFSLTVDWYDIDVKGAFEWSRWGLAFDQCYNQKIEYWCSIYKRDPQTGQLTEIDARYSNSGFVRTRGIDIATNYVVDPRRLGIADNAGTFALSFSGTITTKLERQFAPGTTTWSCLGYHGFNCGDPTPKWRHVAGINWNLPWLPASLGVTWRYTGGTKVSKLSSSTVLAARPTEVSPDTYPLIARLPAYSYIDMAANVKLTDNVTVRFNAQNLFDKDPPLIGAGQYGDIGQYMNTYPAWYTVRGRTVRVGLTARF